MRLVLVSIVGLLATACAPEASETPVTPIAPRPMVVVDEKDVMVEEAPPHGHIGMSTAYHISSQAPEREMDFRRRVLHVGAAVGEHVISHDEVYYVTAGEGEVFSDGETARLGPGMAAYLYNGANVGIRQVGDAPLSIIIAYPLAQEAKASK